MAGDAGFAITLRVTVLPCRSGHATMCLRQQARRGHTLLCVGRSRIRCVDAGTYKPGCFPPAVTQALLAQPIGPSPNHADDPDHPDDPDHTTTGMP